MVQGLFTGIQKDVISLYRKCVRAALKKGASKEEFLAFSREQFERHKDLSRKDFATIEYLLRTGHRKLEMFSNPSLTRVH